MHPFFYILTGTARPGYGACPMGYPRAGEPCPLGNRFTEIFARRPDGVTYRYGWNAASQRYEDSRPESTSWIEEGRGLEGFCRQLRYERRPLHAASRCWRRGALQR